jgi:transposase
MQFSSGTVVKSTYAMRNRIERSLNKLKHSRRVATRYDKLTSSFLEFVQLLTIRIWIRFGHKT